MLTLPPHACFRLLTACAHHPPSPLMQRNARDLEIYNKVSEVQAYVKAYDREYAQGDFDPLR